MKLIDAIANRFGYQKTPAPKPKTEKKAIQKRGFDAGAMSRIFADWVRGPGTSLNEKIRRDLPTMRERARDLTINDDYGKKFLTLCKTNIVGPTGIKLQMDVVDPIGSSDTRANDLIEAAWKEWGKKENCTVTGQNSWLDVQNLIVGTLPPDGEILIRKVRGYDNPWRYAVQLLPNDCLDDQYNAVLPNGNRVRMGVERNAWKKPVAYHLLTENPIDLGFGGVYSSKRERVPAEDIIHRFVPMSIDQARGFPWFHTAMTRLQILGGYEEAALVAARIGACKMGFLKPSASPDQPSGDYTGDGADAQGNKLTDAEPGAFEELPPGFDFQAFDPSHPQTEYSQFTKAVLRGIASGLGVSYNSLAADLEGVNYSSIRAGLLEERDHWMMLQGWLIEQVVNDIFTDWLSWSLDFGTIPLPFTKLAKFNRPKWMGRRWAWVDPEKDINASIKAIDNGLSTRTEELAQSGRDLEETLRTREREKKMEASFGLEFPSELNVQKAALAKAAQPANPSSGER